MAILCDYQTIRDNAIWNSKNLFLNFGSKDIYQLFCSYLSLNDLVSFSQTSAKCHEFVSQYDPLGRCNRLMEAASLMVPFWDRFNRPLILRPILSFKVMFYRMAKVFSNRPIFNPSLERVQLVCSDRVKRHYAFLNGNVQFHFPPTFKQFHHELNGSLELSKIGCLDLPLSDVGVRSDYLLVSLILFSTLEKISTPNILFFPTPIVHLKKHLKKLEKEGLKPVSGKNSVEDFKYEVIERVVWALLSKLYLVNIEPVNMQEAEPLLRKFIRVAIAEIEARSGVEVIERLAKTVELTFNELEPIFDTAIRLAKQQADKMEIQRIISQEIDGEMGMMINPSFYNAVPFVLLRYFGLGGIFGNVDAQLSTKALEQFFVWGGVNYILAAYGQIAAHWLIRLYFPPKVQLVENNGIRQKNVEMSLAGRIARTATSWSFKLVNVGIAVAIVYDIYRRFM